MRQTDLLFGVFLLFEYGYCLVFHMTQHDSVLGQLAIVQYYTVVLCSIVSYLLIVSCYNTALQ